jgi:hypothetical protein
MTLPIATTTITVTRTTSGADVDPYVISDDSSTVVASGVRAVIGPYSGSEFVRGGEQSIVNATMQCDACDVTHYDRVTDAMTGDVFSVISVQSVQGFGLDHYECQLKRIDGAV